MLANINFTRMMHYFIKMMVVLVSMIFEIEIHSQGLIPYTDSVNHFSIGLTASWQYQFSQTSGQGIKLFVVSPKSKDSGKVVESYNVNIVPFPNSTLEAAYSDLKVTISKRKGYVFVNEKDTSINGVMYKWLVENHQNNQTSQPMTALIVLGYKNDNAYMVTFAAAKEFFHKYESIFVTVASTFTL